MYELSRELMKELKLLVLGNRGHSRPPKSQILTHVLKMREKPAVKHSIEKHVLLNFVRLSKISCLI